MGQTSARLGPDAKDPGLRTQAGTLADDLEHHTRRDPHDRAGWLSDVILGGQDGLVNVLGVILGVAAATRDLRIVLVAGLAATFAESVSMAAVAYTSTLAEADRYRSERAREYRHIRQVPQLERDEIRQIYQRRGFSGRLLEDVVATITADEDVWVDIMMGEELQLAPATRRGALLSGVVVGISALVGSLIPLVPFLLMPVGAAMLAALVVSALALFLVGAFKAHTMVGHPGRSGLEMALIGTVSALVGFGVGWLLRIPPAP